jgi:hypothetical protein
MRAMQKRGTITRQQCGAKTEARATAKFCSGACNYRHHNDAKAEAKREAL